MDFAAISNMLLEIFYIIIGIMMLNTAVLTLGDKNHKAKIGTAAFWGLLGIIFIYTISSGWSNISCYSSTYFN